MSVATYPLTCDVRRLGVKDMKCPTFSGWFIFSDKLLEHTKN